MVYLLLALGLVLLIYGGDLLVRGAVSLAKRTGVSPLLIGLTLVGFGTSTPELVTSLIAVFKQSEGIAVGNVIGSNIANIFLVLGAAAIISPVQVDIKSFKRDSVFLLISTLALVIALLMGTISFSMGVILTALLVLYVAYSYFSDKKQQKKKKLKKENLTQNLSSVETPSSLETKSNQNTDSSNTSLEASSENGWLSLFKTILGISLTLLGAKLLVDNSIIIARSWGISEAVIGLTLVAVGTSLPELVTSVVSAIRKHNDVAFGNVVGSNIYNALFILGVTALFMPVKIPTKMGSDIAVMSFATLVLIGIAFWRKKFSRLVGFLFLLLYALYTYYLFLPH